MQQDAKEFHVSREARDRYQFDQALYSIRGTVVFANFQAARLFAQRINAQREVARQPNRAVTAGQVNAMALIHEILHATLTVYQRQSNPNALGKALEWLETTYGPEHVQTALRGFVAEFPTLAVYRNEVEAERYLAGTTDGTPNRQVVLEEMLLLWLANLNPAFSPLGDVFDDYKLETHTSYPTLISGLRDFFAAEPPLAGNMNLIDLLRAPALAAPHDLQAQLRFIQENWGFVRDLVLIRILSSLDLIREEEKFGFMGAGPTQVLQFGAAALQAAGFGGDEAEALSEPERYSMDREWMPELVMLAKSSYVWLDQLSKSYGRSITRLDEIPDEELDRLARWGFTGLWLIGLWERSRASQTIKQLCGNPDAVASAYSLMDYNIAADLGGETAYNNLRDRAWQRGIRLASDMVPNHMGIDSRWVIEHPDWFLAVPSAPFPSYSFNGPNLSQDGRVGIYLEDHYYTQSDAAVVFKRVDHHTGETRYIYHGNDGTTMPWNDTAQLDYLNPAVREAVIQTILHVARMFPIIRFDAAMTLAKRHVQRLWYPEPGTGGAIASRADHAMSRADFNGAMPEEFWREVVDRVAQEVPNTLLLAEAFWMMEGYFVRTLGMHRVYNSAFMNMLKNEENDKYRATIKNTLEFDPEILKRFVNFMNNPDEKTAVAQFGKDDKYFGVCMLMITMPGLPMIGHGQVEGFTEKYGMEYRRAYWDEQPDRYLIERHEREIFPLMHRRRLFANVDHFLLYDFWSTNGGVNEDVFAYTNGAGNERCLMVYHNKFDTTRGWIRTSAAYSVKTGNGDERTLVQKTLGEGLNLHNEDGYFVILRDQIAGLDYIRSSKQIHEHGMYIELEAFKYQVFIDIREVHDATQQSYGQLAVALNGRGVPNIDEALREHQLQPILRPFQEFANAGMWRWLIDNRTVEPLVPPADAPLDEAAHKFEAILAASATLSAAKGDQAAVAREMRETLEMILALPVLKHHLDFPASTEDDAAVAFLSDRLDDDPALWGTLFGWLAVEGLGQLTGAGVGTSRDWIDGWMLHRPLSTALHNLGVDDPTTQRQIVLIKTLIAHQDWFVEPSQGLARLFADPAVQHFVGINHYQGVQWFNQESFDQLLWWLFVIAVLTTTVYPQAPQGVDTEVVAMHAELQRWRAAAEAAGYQVEKLLRNQPSATKSATPPASPVGR